jgi:alpha-D-ribose 1-methylphosphonate 5-triphosphate synthase subunit PhnG
MSSSRSQVQQAARQQWMAVLARCDGAELEAVLNSVDAIPDYQIVKAPETGTVMIEGRAGGAGRRFNLGEATVSRAVVRLPDGTMGFSYALGQNRRKALVAAVLDALLQVEARQGGELGQKVRALGNEQVRRREQASRKAAATKVEFFTLVRGD